MTKELIFVHDWIGANGPIHNHRIPDFYDIAKRMPYANCDQSKWATNEIDPLVMDLRMHTRCRIVPSYDLGSIYGKTFFYELQLSQKTGFTSISLSSQIGILNSGPVNQSVLSAVRMGHGYILLTCILESFLEDDVFHKIYQYFSEHNISLDRVIYLTNCANAQELHNDFCNRHGIEPKLICEYVGLYILNQSGILQDKRFEHRSLRNQLETKKKLFLNLNRRSRQHRYVVLLKMYEMGLLDDCMISFLKEHADENHWINELRSFCTIFNINLPDQKLFELYHKLPLTLDTDNFDRFPMEDDLFSTASLYDRTYISLVSETNFENNIIHMTEKTIKPIVFKHPFIIVGPKGTLKKLKDMGFRTFSDHWDESYDDEKDPNLRMSMVLDVCKTISSWSKQQLTEFLFRSYSTVIYNFNHFKTKQTSELNRFVERYGADIK